MEEGASEETKKKANSSGKLFECPNSGCRLMTFKYSSQLSRHKKTCSKPPANIKSLKWYREGMSVYPALKAMRIGQIYFDT